MCSTRDRETFIDTDCNCCFIAGTILDGDVRKSAIMLHRCQEHKDADGVELVALVKRLQKLYLDSFSGGLLVITPPAFHYIENNPVYQTPIQEKTGGMMTDLDTFVTTTLDANDTADYAIERITALNRRVAELEWVCDKYDLLLEHALNTLSLEDALDRVVDALRGTGLTVKVYGGGRVDVEYRGDRTCFCDTKSAIPYIEG